VVTQMSPITVIFTISQDNLPAVLQQTRAGRQLVVQALDSSGNNVLSTGKLTSVDNQIDTVTGTVKLRAQFPNTKGVLFPNQFVNTRLLVETLQKQTLIPDSAIQHNGSVSYVYLIHNNKAVMRNVKTGVSNEGQTAVTGIDPGDVVANSSFQKLLNGSTVAKSNFAITPTEPSAGITQ
jgi:membrane fusion protein, multidrug efflux system